MPVIPVNNVVDKKKIIGYKVEGRGGGEAHGVADPQKYYFGTSNVSAIGTEDRGFESHRGRRWKGVVPSNELSPGSLSSRK
jgi:hypothetical protein